MSENLLKQDFYASGRTKSVLVTLHTYARMTAQLACDALQMAFWRRKRPENVIVHTDRGGQYCSADYRALLKRHNLRGSMSA